MYSTNTMLYIWDSHLQMAIIEGLNIKTLKLVVVGKTPIKLEYFSNRHLGTKFIIVWLDYNSL